jgi:hypothetical protein
VDDLRLSDVGKARLFRGAISRDRAGLLPICSTETDWRNAPALAGVELRKFWERIWDSEQNTIGGSKEERELAAWRITRQLAVLRGAIEPNAPLSNIAEGADVLESDFTSFNEINDWALRKLLERGTPMTVPDIPATMLLHNGTVVSDSYDPKKDQRLHRFQQVVEYFGKASLQLDSSARACRGFAWFLSPETIRAGWPSPPSLFLFEARLVEHAISQLTDGGDDSSRAEIASRWDLLPQEVCQVMALARLALSMRYDTDDLKGGKALALARLEAQISKAQDALDHRGAGMMIREWWRIFRDKGDAQVEDEFGDMDGVIQASAKQKRLSKPKPKDTP